MAIGSIQCPSLSTTIAQLRVSTMPSGGWTTCGPDQLTPLSVERYNRVSAGSAPAVSSLKSGLSGSERSHRMALSISEPSGSRVMTGPWYE